MTTKQMADRYMELSEQGKSDEIQATLYGTDIICKEPEHAVALGIPVLTKGLDNVKAKSKARRDMIAEIHSGYCSEPVVGGKYFSVAMGREVTFKNGERRKFDEIAIFEVKDDKIVSETFFY